MESAELFAMALQLSSPWFIDKVELVDSSAATPMSGRELHIRIDFKRGGLFRNSLGEEKTAYDTVDKTWQHLNFFQHRCFIHARVPRIADADGKIRFIDVPWARSGSGFTLLFEAFAMLLIESEMPVSKAADVVGVYPQRLWNMFSYWVRRAFDKDDQTGITRIGIDETSTKKGHNYVTVAVDLDRRRVVKVTPGKGSACVKTIGEHLSGKGSDPAQVGQVCIDMSPAFISGCMNTFGNAAITFDKFHVVKEINKAMDEVRKLERKEFEMLKGHKYTLLKNHNKLTDKQKKAKADILEFMPSMAKAYQLKELFHAFWDFTEADEAAAYLAYWCDLVQESRIYPFIRAANTIKAHWSGIVNYIDSRINNGILEGINAKIQLAKKRARGYRNIDNFIHMIYFTCSKLNFDYPQYSI